ncbi:RNA polymerase sigma factor [Kitasatospora sp. NPDC004745]|uniref:RNA polymerase sigma factor n=1 Tax=Kitasatospora sp. NPDC004745 TaxID=3364019 RepID=UPI00367FD1AC
MVTPPDSRGEACLDLTPEELRTAEELHDEVFDLVTRALVKKHGLNFQDSEDITSATFVTVLRRWRKIDADKRRGYFFTAAMHMAINHFRKQQSIRDAESKAAERDWGAPSAEAELERKEKIGAVRAAVEALPGKKSREVLIYQCDGLDDSEIAEKTGKNEATVRSQRSKSLPYLREALSDYGKAGE